ncbi:type I methionyl aminopeptidase [Candidatus Gottesmanbacteria bacterium RIFCSPHIGHO2_02_FULL_40_13]|uniref:Methionine aminopeptidase n=1 Tax=Candidatus Gottesmanbacteria bacterium RIFCSPHIGHO2_02_FULL_40_13 TaxID=1798384 RepID=A0A1F6A7M6_9BACT|nr:MAG: type I methionyl aminopeptidase [Candidatus Gottesmanbacteria bacterium RIFCSPHIGHO2_02_FULL_40_13]
MIKLKTPKDLEIMKKGGEILSEILFLTLSKVRAGVSLLELDKFAENEILKRNAQPAFKRVKGYQWTICACVNDVVVHGIPDPYIIQPGDVVGVDCGVYFLGFNTDASWTIRVEGGENAVLKDRFLAAGQNALLSALKKVTIGNYIYDISRSMQDSIEKEGYSIVRTLVGHGVGRDLHEEPEIPNFVTLDREKTPLIKEGMTLAVEIIYNLGGRDVVYKGNDGWTIATKDGRISGLFEATVVPTFHGCLVLTKLDSILEKFSYH